MTTQLCCSEAFPPVMLNQTVGLTPGMLYWPWSCLPGRRPVLLGHGKGCRLPPATVGPVQAGGFPDSFPSEVIRYSKNRSTHLVRAHFPSVYTGR